MDKNCTVFKTMDYISKKWSVIIILELNKSKTKSKRYSEIKNKIPHITPKILSARLKELKKNGLIEKKIDAKQIPIKTFYSLTHSGKDFIRIIKSIKNWALKWNIKNEICRKTNCKKCYL